MIIDTDYLLYRPVSELFGSSKMGLRKMPAISSVEKEKIFQIDRRFAAFYRASKCAQRSAMALYYQQKDSAPVELLNFIIKTLIREQGAFFRTEPAGEYIELHCALSGDVIVYDCETLELVKVIFTEDNAYKFDAVDLFDAIAMQLPCDLVFHKVEKKKEDHASIIHLFHANGWGADTAIGKTFKALHKDVFNISKIIPNFKKILSAIMSSIHSMERIGGVHLRTTPDLNRHPILGRDMLDPDFKGDWSSTYLRFERQTVTPVKKAEGFLFTINTYITSMSEVFKDKAQVSSFKVGFDQFNEHSKAVSFLNENKEAISDSLPKS